MASWGRQPGVEVPSAGKQREGPEFPEARGALAVAVRAAGQDGHKGDVCVARGQGVVDVVADVEGGGRIAFVQDFQQALRVRLDLVHVVHGDDRAEVRGGRPTVKRERKFPTVSTGEQVQLEAASPTRDLARGDEKFFVADIAEFTIRSPIEFLE